MASKHRKKKWCESEKPNNASAGSKTREVVTAATPNLAINLALNKLETTVPPAIIMEMIPAKWMGTAKSTYIVGHAGPSNESGSPRLINARYITTRISAFYTIGFNARSRACPYHK